MFRFRTETWYLYYDGKGLEYTEQDLIGAFNTELTAILPDLKELKKPNIDYVKSVGIDMQPKFNDIAISFMSLKAFADTPEVLPYFNE